MRPLPLFAAPLALLIAATARADSPDPSVALWAGAATSVAGIVTGSTIMGAGNRSELSNNAGWLTMCGAFTLTPIVAHAVEGEWLRGLVFASLPAATTGGTGALFAVVPGTVDHGTLEEQRLMWGLFGLGFVGAVVGVVDATFALQRTRARELVVAPMAGAGQLGLEIAGLL